MKLFRKPSLNKKIAANTIGKVTRKMKSNVNPLYGKDGMGILDPKKKVYNKVYNKVNKKIF